MICKATSPTLHTGNVPVENTDGSVMVDKAASRTGDGDSEQLLTVVEDICHSDVPMGVAGKRAVPSVDGSEEEASQAKVAKGVNMKDVHSFREPFPSDSDGSEDLFGEVSETILISPSVEVEGQQVSCHQLLKVPSVVAPVEESRLCLAICGYSVLRQKMGYDL
ncbi:unnamed protein product [Cyprideis torosa]|uniref:Uncharacterized protein n=1 Tax=Cyprideis torosa TaxID=163714 RepID=A0A7R8WPY5_9CRUS|nr:unnamed protein product [Cyprideis torosa]CAG0902378.1 unnamed protein product [Cyprideis torosa]